MNNAQTFSQSSGQYARSRPQYPAKLFAYLSELCATHDSAWDCATGNGQAAVSLASHFAHIEATDVSPEQIQHSIAHPRVRYSVSPAEHTVFANESFDLVTVATAVHWFDQEAFFTEVDRVLKPNGILAIWSYSFFTIEPVLDQVINDDFFVPIDPYWAEGNRQMFNGYKYVMLPFDEIQPPEISMQIDWTLEQLLGFFQTWSAVKRFIADHGTDPVAKIRSILTPLWGKESITKLVKMPLHIRVSRKTNQ